MTKHQATALREQVTGERRPDSRGQGVEAKAKATIFCPRGVLEVEDSPRGPHPWGLLVLSSLSAVLVLRVYSLTLCEPVGEGNFGVVYRATLHRNDQHSTVAVKMLKGCNFYLVFHYHSIHHTVTVTEMLNSCVKFCAFYAAVLLFTLCVSTLPVRVSVCLSHTWP